MSGFPRVPHTQERLKEIWMEMFCGLVAATCRNEEDEHLLQMSMLLKTVYWTHKDMLAEWRKERKAFEQALEEQKLKSEALEAEILRLSALHQHSSEPERMQSTQIAGTQQPSAVPALVELQPSALPVHDVTSSISASTSPAVSVQMVQGGKRLSDEGMSDELDAPSRLKKAKVASPPTTPKDGTHFFVPETLRCTDEIFPVHKRGFVSESPDMFLENRHVLCDLEQTPKDMSPSLIHKSPSVTPKSPISSPKSPVILTGRARRNMSENQENRSPSLLAASQVPNRPSHIINTVTLSSTIAESSTAKSDIMSNTLTTTKSSNFDPSPVKSSPKRAGLLGYNENKSVGNMQPLITKDSAIDKNVLSKTNIFKKSKTKLVSKYEGGLSKLEISPADKSFKNTKLKQSKLSLSMFQPKKTIPATKTHLMDEGEQLKLALKESLKNSEQALDLNQTFFEILPPSETQKTYFEEDFGLGILPLDVTDESLEQLKTAKKGKMSPPAAHAEARMAETEKMFSPATRAEVAKTEKMLPPATRAQAGIIPTSHALPPLSSIEKEYIESYDKVPSKPKTGPDYVYHGPVVRKQAERKQLPGWECHECKIFFDVCCKDMSSQERRQVVDRCSKHRQALPVINNTPPGVWDLNLLQTQLNTTQTGQLQVRHRVKEGERLIDKATKVSPTSSIEFII